VHSTSYTKYPNFRRKTKFNFQMNQSLPKLVVKRLFVTFAFICVLSTTHAQGFFSNIKYELGFNAGPNFFLGDLGGNSGKGKNTLKDLNLELTKLNKGIFFAAYPKEWVGLRIAINQTYLEGRDDIITTTGIDELWRKQRNLDFRTKILEGYVGLEIYPLSILRKKYEDDVAPKVQPYIMAGVGMFKFNPQGSLTDASGNKVWYDLQPLHTEGQGFKEYPNSTPYKLIQMHVPLAVGFKFNASERLNFGTELLYRKTFTDYIDDVSKQYVNPSAFYANLPATDADLAYKLSDKTIPIFFPGQLRFAGGTQRGDTKDGDTFFSVVAKIGIRLGKIENERSSIMRQTKCPSLF
jgi:hypothetical protein